MHNNFQNMHYIYINNPIQMSTKFTKKKKTIDIIFF